MDHLNACYEDKYGTGFNNAQIIMYSKDCLEYVDDINDYRHFECVVFYSQALSIVIYIGSCIAFYEAKKCMNQKDKNDPYIKIIRNKKEDFLKTENFFMSI